MIESYISVSINFYPKFKWIESIHVGHKHGKPVGTGLLNQLSIQGTDLKNQPIVSSCVTHIFPFCGYFKDQEEICFNPTSWHLVTYNFYEVINIDR